MTEVTPADLEEIRGLKSRYFRYVDTKRWGDLRTLFARDAVFDGFAFATAGPDAFVAGVAAYLDGIESVHQGFMPELRAIGDNRVRGIWSMFDQLTWAPGSRGYKGIDLGGQWGIRGYGHYEEEYARTADGWRICFMRLTRLRVEPLVGDGHTPPPYDLPRLTPGWLD
ncbi:nuclear transport factor 2 family protein [Microbacterium chocolatum]|uniref:nuclear transport factor 2 family protein n=1 Tax=Microbacterium aurantiacum TaxID=162393 RepID=UPI00338EF5A4